MILRRDHECFDEASANEWQPEEHLDFSTTKWRSSDHASEKLLRQQWRPLRQNLNHISKAVEDARYLLDLTDENDQPACTRATWDRAVLFLSDCARRAWETAGIKIDAPAILPGPDGSIDLHWKQAGYEMLINIPVDASEHPNYYGDDHVGNSTKGIVVSGNNQGLILWLTTRK